MESSLKIMNMLYDVKQNMTDAQYKDLCEEVMHMNKRQKLEKTENVRMEEALQALDELTYEHVKFYYDLVWYARRDPEKDKEHIERFKNKIDTEHGEKADEMRKACADLRCASCGEVDEWNNGFNHGMLAASRLYSSFVSLEDEELCDEELITPEEQRENALEMFPDMDT